MSEDLVVDVSGSGAVVRARLVGSLDAATLPTFLDAVEPLTVAATRVVFDCTDLEFCDSSGLRGIVMIRNALGRPGAVRLEGASAGLRQILRITGLTDLLADDAQE